MPEEEKQCRICLDGTESERELGRLIRPCLCKGSISVSLPFWLMRKWSWNPYNTQYVHLKCLQRWRSMSSSKSAFFACPQCRYQYRFARTHVVGIATNPGAYTLLQFQPIPGLSHILSSYRRWSILSAFYSPCDDCIVHHHILYLCLWGTYILPPFLFQSIRRSSGPCHCSLSCHEGWRFGQYYWG